MVDAKQTFPIDDVSRFTLEVRGSDVQIRWVDDADEVRVLSGELDFQRTGDELFAKGSRTGEENDEDEDYPEIRISGFESPAQAVEEILFRTGIFGGRSRSSKKGSPISLEIPASIQHTTLEIQQGDLGMQGPRGVVVCKLKRGDVTSNGGNAEIDVSAGSGTVTVTGLAGALRVAGGSGDISVTDVEAVTNIKAGSGQVSLRRVSGDAIKLAAGSGDITVLDCRTSAYSSDCGSGDVQIEDGTLDRISVRTGSGDVECSAVFGPHSQSFTTGSGSISLGVPRNLSARIEAFTSSGDIDTELPLVSVGQRGPKSRRSRRQVGSVGSGDPRAEVSLRTSSGDIRINWLTQSSRRDAIPMPPPVPNVPEVPSEPNVSATRTDSDSDETTVDSSPQSRENEWQAVLESLANGEITVEEADALLESIEGRRANARR